MFCACVYVDVCVWMRWSYPATHIHVPTHNLQYHDVTLSSPEPVYSTGCRLMSPCGQSRPLNSIPLVWALWIRGYTPTCSDSSVPDRCFPQSSLSLSLPSSLSPLNHPIPVCLFLPLSSFLSFPSKPPLFLSVSFFLCVPGTVPVFPPFSHLSLFQLLPLSCLCSDHLS